MELCQRKGNAAIHTSLVCRHAADRHWNEALAITVRALGKGKDKICTGRTAFKILYLQQTWLSALTTTPGVEGKNEVFPIPFWFPLCCGRSKAHANL